MRTLSTIQLRACIWCGPALMVLFSAGLILLAGFFPPPSPDDSSARIAEIYADDKTAIRIGCVIMIIGLVFLIPWGIALAHLTKRMEAVPPLLASGQQVCLAVSTAMIVLIPTVWALAAFRPGDVSPDVTRTVNDFGWFLLLFAWPPFSIWNAFTAAAILSDDSERPLLPRWAGYLTIWDALLLAPGGLMAFFKTGPFAWDGVMAFYIPLTVFFVWMVGMTVVMLRTSVDERLTVDADLVAV